VKKGGKDNQDVENLVRLAQEVKAARVKTFWKPGCIEDGTKDIHPAHWQHNVWPQL